MLTARPVIVQIMAWETPFAMVRAYKSLRTRYYGRASYEIT